MGELNLERRIKHTICLAGLFLIGLDAAAVIVAVARNTPVVLIPFAVATSISFVAIWWAHRDRVSKRAV